MWTRQSNSFRESQDISERGSIFRSEYGMRGRSSNSNEEGPSLLNVLRLWLLGGKRFWMALKYQVFRLLPGSGELPWIKLAIAAILIFVVFKRDLSFQVGLHAPDGSEEQSHLDKPVEARFSTTGTLAKVMSYEPEKKEAPKVDPFVDLPGDDEEDKRIKAYVRRFREVAQTEMKQFGIPASIKMAQALVESNAGNSKLATRNNNHFGIKCFSKKCGKGHCSNFSDDHHKDFFRKYESAWFSWRAHSKLLDQARYKVLQKHGTDYRAWAKGLSELGYATDKRYEQKLIEKIEEYKLYELDE